MDVNGAAHMNLLEMLRVGQQVPSAVIPTIHEYKRNLLRQAEVLRKAYATAIAEIQRCEGLFAPIRALPRELLLSIFMHVGDTSASPVGSRVVIGRVCRHWRSITTSSAAFWSKIDMHCARGQVPNRHVLAQCLVLSYPLPLELSLDVPVDNPLTFAEEGIIDDVLYLLDGHVSRLRSFKCVGPCRTVDLVFDTFAEHKLQNLKSLEIRYRGVYDALYMPNLDAPFVDTITLNLYTTVGFQPSPSLTTFSGIFAKDRDLHVFLRDVPSLNTLHIMHIGPNPNNPFPPFTHHILTNLRKLSLQFCAISTVFQYFKFPNLESFVMPNTYTLQETHPTHCVQSRVSPASVDIIRDLIQRSGCSLQHLEIGNFIPPTMFLPVYQHCAPTVTTLHVEFHTEDSDDILPTVEMLTIPDAASQAEHVLPHLTDLTMVICSTSTEHILFRLEQTKKMIGSRWGGASPLKRLRLDGKVHPEETTPLGLRTSSLALFLRGLQKEGLDVTWIVEGDDMLMESQEDERAFRLLTAS